MILLTGAFRPMKSFSLPLLSFFKVLDLPLTTQQRSLDFYVKGTMSSVVEDTNDERIHRFHS